MLTDHVLGVFIMLTDKLLTLLFVLICRVLFLDPTLYVVLFLRVRELVPCLGDLGPGGLQVQVCFGKLAFERFASLLEALDKVSMRVLLVVVCSLRRSKC